MRNHFYILGSVFFTVYGQMIVKWQVAKAGPFPTSAAQRAAFLLSLVFNPWVLTAVFGGFMAMQCWMAALTKFELSYAYPFMSLAFVLVLILSVVLFRESVTAPKLIGITLIIAGIIISSRG